MPKELKAPKVFKVYKVDRALKVLKVQQVLQAQQVTTDLIQEDGNMLLEEDNLIPQNLQQIVKLFQVLQQLILMI